MVMPDDENDITWDDKNITSNGEVLPYTIKGNTLTIQEGSNVAIFKK